ncbi:MAG: DUF3095 family protein [Melioribacteraceae bacterium]|nr:DUF3095 family protein [Melioribacteraceae bacterium]MCF8356645.1 DUF3095 family protein [Melioribacteraceae bacterium]MCF8396021.1 DUF3095 family protein [Melioribacteraceae bacterium]
MMNENFYQNLPVLNNYADVADFSNYHAIPSDWHIIVSDVTGSTEATGKGKFKEVNILELH